MNFDRVLLVVTGRDLFLVDGLVGLLEQRGFTASARSDRVTGDVPTNRRSVRRATISIVVLNDHEEFARALPVVRTQTPIVVVSAQKLTPSEAAAALLANVVAMVNPSTGIDGLVSTLDAVEAGSVGWPLEQFLAATRFLRDRPESRSNNLSLTQREHEVLRMLHQGESIRSLAALLQISPKTVESLQRGLYRKLGARNKIQAIEVGVRTGLL
jgi:DNA-binding NarL/FixJ family response regulator